MLGQETPHGAPAGRGLAQACSGCGAEVVTDLVEGGLHCATCGQWQYLCDGCMPKVSEHSRDAAWRCPECRQDARFGAH
jgi:DNA-directed RNA polymerase subunit RPC12/RpoP